MSRLDMLLWVFSSAADSMISDLLPKGSCSRDRWLTFHLEAVDEDGNSFRYLAQYSAPSNYIYYRMLLPDGIEHVRLDDNHNRNSDRFRRSWWVPMEDLRTPERLRAMSGKELAEIAEDLGLEIPGGKWSLMKYLGPHRNEVIRQAREYPKRTGFLGLGGDLITAPGTVYKSGSHDSCWRDKIMEFTGWPMIDTGRTWERTWKDGETTTGKVWEPTTYFNWVKVETMRVHKVTIQGPRNEEPWSLERHPTIEDGEWVNPDPDNLVNAFAIFAAWGALRHCIGAVDPLQIPLDTTVQYYRPAKNEAEQEDDRFHNGVKMLRTKEKRETVYYRIGPDGKLRAVAQRQANVYAPAAWESAEDTYLSREMHLTNLGVGQDAIRNNRVGIAHMHTY